MWCGSWDKTPCLPFNTQDRYLPPSDWINLRINKYRCLMAVLCCQPFRNIVDFSFSPVQADCVGTSRTLPQVQYSLQSRPPWVFVTKNAEIIPEDNTNANNYRAISLLSNFKRIFEKLVYSRMESFISKMIYFLHLNMASAKRIQRIQFLTL